MAQVERRPEPQRVCDRRELHGRAHQAVRPRSLLQERRPEPGLGPDRDAPQHLIGERTAEEIKIKIGSAYPYEGEGAIDVKGRNLVDGLPKNIEVTSEEVREALADSVNQILDAIRTTLEKTPPELAADIIDQGIMLTGGGALLRGLDRLISAETKMPVHVAENPLDCVVDGTGVCLENDMLSLTSTKNYDE